MRIEVTLEDIYLGERRNGYKCPIALAIKRVTGSRIVAAKSFEIYVRTTEGESRRWNVPLSVKEFMENFDLERYVEPFSFELGDPHVL